MPIELLTPAQQTVLHTELDTDPESLGYSPYLAIDDFNSLFTLLTCIRDGITPCPANGVIGPNGTIVGATNAAPIVIQTGSAHGRATGDSVFIPNVGGNTAADGYWTITVVDSTHFSLNGSVGNGAYTSGGTWNWCVTGIRQQLTSSQSLCAAMVHTDLVTDSITTGQMTPQQLGRMILAQIILNQYGGEVQLTNPLTGAETANVGTLKSMFNSGSGTVAAIAALKTRIGSRAELLFGISNPYTYLDNTGTAPTVDDIAVALGDNPP